RISETEFAIGQLRLNRKQRSVRFPAVVNMTDGMVEYVCTTRYGKTHETLFATDVLPVEVHLAMLLISDTGEIPKSGTADSSLLPAGTPIDVHVEWRDSTNTISLPAEKLVLDHKTRKALKPGLFVYTSSRMRDEVFLGQLEGSIISLQEDSDALSNIRKEHRRVGDTWIPKPDSLPKVGTPVEIEIRLSSSSCSGEDTKDAGAREASSNQPEHRARPEVSALIQNQQR
ncbi:MAG: YdjY domain-containing protein, partial [Verrucomicrobiales bacterium]|nr:YdjY domain-containing protein [Verrucomicrobiales bacterium]